MQFFHLRTIKRDMCAYCVDSDTPMFLPEHRTSSMAAPFFGMTCQVRYWGDKRSKKQFCKSLKRVKYLKKIISFLIPQRFLLLPLKPRVCLLLPRNIVASARHQNKQAHLNRHFAVRSRLPAQVALQEQFLASALYSAISRDSPKRHVCPKC